MKRTTIIVTAAVIAATAASAGPAEASHVECGDEITADTTLDSDLIDCESNGIVIGADDITLDLDGHLIDGDEAEDMTCAKAEFCDVGVVLAGHDDVAVKGGTVREFGVGVIVAKGSGSSLAHVRATRNTASGEILFKSERTTLRDDLFRSNGLETDQAGLTVIKTSKLRVARSEIRDNGDIGIYGEENAGSEIVENEIAGNPEAGILIDGAHMRFARNLAIGNGEGIVASGTSNTIKRNTVRRGIDSDDADGLGISVEEGSGNRIIGNRVEDVDGPGIRVAGWGRVQHVLIARNTVRGAGEDAFQVKSVLRPVTDVVLRHNHAQGAGGDGIDVSIESARVGHNRADGNGDLGIEAAKGVIDLGGNHAARNGDSRQCVNVACA